MLFLSPDAQKYDSKVTKVKMSTQQTAGLVFDDYSLSESKYNVDKQRRKVNKTIPTWVIIIRLKAHLGPEDFIHTVYNNAAHAAQRALSWLREESKTSITRHKLAVYNRSHTRCGHTAFSHNDRTGGTEPCRLDTFGYSQFHGNSEVLMRCGTMAKHEFNPGKVTKVPNSGL